MVFVELFEVLFDNLQRIENEALIGVFNKQACRTLRGLSFRKVSYCVYFFGFNIKLPEIVDKVKTVNEFQ